MTGRRAQHFYPVTGLGLAVCAPSLTVLAVLAGWGLLAPRAALIAGVVILVSTALVIGRPVRDLMVVRAALDWLAADDVALDSPSRQTARRLAPLAREIWLAVTRLSRVWRERVRIAEGQLAAAEAIITAIPDPLILLDNKRRIVRANAEAAAFVGALAVPRDLAAVLRN